MNDLLATIRKTLFTPVHPAGFPFIGIFAAVTLVLSRLPGHFGAAGFVLTLWCIYFFRNPHRVTPIREGLVVSPADGIVQMIVEAPLPPELDDCKGQGDALCDAKTLTRVSVFLNVFDVHINRIPADGEIKKVVYRPGKFFNASLDKASIDNERSTVLMKLTGHASSIAFVQIAGLVARRIICKLTAGQNVKTGNIYGLIRFGSRVDIFLPPGVAPLVCVGQRMIGGETVIADFKSGEAARTGEDRA
jgi:phosphatidylserine decarboxylase